MAGALLSATVMVGSSDALEASVCGASGSYTSCLSFDATGGNQTFTVPKGVTSLYAMVDGAGGGPSTYDGPTGGSGGEATGTFAVTPGDTLNITVGTSSGFGGGGTPGGNGSRGRGGTGGGLSAIWTGPALIGTPVILAGGGGGSAGAGAPPKSGGDGGGAAGTNGRASDGTQYGGSGGGQSGGGAGGQNGGTAGGPFQGGNGSDGVDSGGGGGGGWFGGGGGHGQVGLFDPQNDDGGGGGGSGYLSSAISGGTLVTGAGAGSASSGSVVLKWIAPAAVITEPADGSTTTAEGRPTITGTGVSGTVVTVIDGGTTTLTCAEGTVTVALTGSWTCTPTTSLTIGQHTLIAVQTDPASPQATYPSSNSVTVTVPGVPPAITTTSVPVATNGIAYSTTVDATGTAPITYTVSVGALPAGLTLDPNTGTITGTASTDGTFTFTVTATNDYGANTHDYSIQVGSAPVITTGNPPNAGNGASYSTTVTSTGTGAATYTVTAGALPSGLTLDPDTGTITGTPTATGTATFTVTATNAFGAGSKELTLTVGDAPTITSTAPSASVPTGQPYSFTITSTGTGAATYTLSAGDLPAGLTLDSVTGVISGTPTTIGAATFTVQVSNAFGTADQAGTITVGDAPAITSGPPPLATDGRSYSFTVTNSGSGTPTYAVTSGALPTGLHLDPATGEITGTPTTVGTATFAIGVTTDFGSATQDMSITVGNAPTITSAPPTPVAVNGVAYDFPVTAAGTGDTTYTVSAGILPPGLTLDPVTGKLSGTPTANGTVTFTITATNAFGAADQDATITVGTAPSIAAVSPPAGTAGSSLTLTVQFAGSGTPTFAITDGNLPPGLALDPATGVISGTPTTSGTYTFTVSATTAFGRTAEQYTLTINPTPTTVSTTETAPPTETAPSTAPSTTTTAGNTDVAETSATHVVPTTPVSPPPPTNSLPNTGVALTTWLSVALALLLLGGSTILVSRPPRGSGAHRG